MMSKKELEYHDKCMQRQRFWLWHALPPIYRHEFTKTMNEFHANGQLHKTFAYRSYLLRTLEPDVCEDYRHNWMTRRNTNWAFAEFDKWFAIAKAEKQMKRTRHLPDRYINENIECFMQYFGWEMIEIQALHSFLPILNRWVQQIAQLPNLLVEFTQTIANTLLDVFYPPNHCPMRGLNDGN